MIELKSNDATESLPKPEMQCKTIFVTARHSRSSRAITFKSELVIPAKYLRNEYSR